MSKNAPVFTADSVGALSDEQLIAWYSRHPNATVKALIGRIEFMLEKHKEELINAYQEGFHAGTDYANGNNPHNLSPDELRLGAIYGRISEEF